MKLGSGFGLRAMADPTQIRDFAQALDGAGFDFVGVGGHVLSQPDGTLPDRPSATYAGPFYDPFVLYSYLAGVTQSIHFQTSILILPSLPTALVAKQATELALLSDNRFELGVGISWSEPEYRALGQDIHNRGRRLEEQVEVLRLLWSQPFVTFKGRYHELDSIGLNRLPAAPIPIWFGTSVDNKVMRRVARLADGWMPQGDIALNLPRMEQYMREAGRDPSQLMVRGGIVAGSEGPAAWLAAANKLAEAGVTHLNLSSPPDLSPAASLQRLIEAKSVLAAALN